MLAFVEMPNFYSVFYTYKLQYPLILFEMYVDINDYDFILLYYGFFSINNFSLKRKMNTEIFSKLNCDLNATKDINDLKQNIVWFDGEVCTVYTYFIL